MKGRDLNIPGHDKDGVIKAVDYLLNLNRGYKIHLGEKVVVIGGGSVALMPPVRPSGNSTIPWKKSR